MAGGPSTPALAAAVSAAGGLGTIAGAQLGPDALREDIRAVRARTDLPFAVNLFAPLPLPRADPDVVAAVRAIAARHRSRLGLDEPEPPQPPSFTVDDQLAVVVEERPAALSFTFGIPPLEAVREAGIVTIG